MRSESTRLNFNSSLKSICDGAPDGIGKLHVITGDFSSKADLILLHASRLSKKFGAEPFLAVTVPRGSRAKRIELVIARLPIVLFFKFSDSKRADQAGLDLQSTIEIARDLNKTTVFGGIICLSDAQSTNISEVFAKKHMPDIDFVDLQTIYNAKSIRGISCQS